jgi:hypothetical protein
VACEYPDQGALFGENENIVTPCRNNAGVNAEKGEVKPVFCNEMGMD